MKDKSTKAENTIVLEDQKPLLFGEGSKGIRLNGLTPEVVEIGDQFSQDGILVHDEKAASSHAFMLSRLRNPEFPEPIGVFRDVDRPTYDTLLNDQVKHAEEKFGKGELDSLFGSGDTWTVE